jgi:hypothetical protein
LASVLAAGLLLRAGCNGPEAPIWREQAQFEQVPAEAQAMIR